MTAAEALREMQRRAQERWEAGEYESAATTNDLQAWADAIEAELKAKDAEIARLTGELKGEPNNG